MKILLHSGHLSLIEKSGVGRAIYHQKKALEENNIPFTVDKNDYYDIIHINTIFPSSFLLSKKAKRKGKKIVFHAHSTEEDFRNSFIGSNIFAPVFKKWIIKCYESGDLIITPTDYSKGLLEGYGIKTPIVSISNGIDLDFYKKSDKLANNFRNKYNFNACDKVVISVGLYIERKGILDFVALAERMPDYKFVWFGYSDLKTVPSAVRRAVNKKLPNLFFPGYVSKEEIREALSGSDLFLFLTHEETEGIVLMEALAMKVPVLVRDIPIYKKILTDGENIYKGNSINEFENKIQQILTGELPPLVEKGYDIVKDRNIKSVGKQLVTQYKKLFYGPLYS